MMQCHWRVPWGSLGRILSWLSTIAGGFLILVGAATILHLATHINL